MRGSRKLPFYGKDGRAERKKLVGRRDQGGRGRKADRRSDILSTGMRPWPGVRGPAAPMCPTEHEERPLVCGQLLDGGRGGDRAGDSWDCADSTTAGDHAWQLCDHLRDKDID